MQQDKTGYRILVVEDNPGDYILIEDFLREYILAPVIEHVVNFADAKNLLNQTLESFDVIFLDLSLPDASGEPLIADVMNLADHTPVIVLTGYTDIAFSIRSLSIGVADYLLKDELSANSLYKSMVYNIERNKTLQELELSEKRYSDLFHLSPQPMFVCVPETLKILDVNIAAINKYGYTREEFLRLSFSSLLDTEAMKELVSPAGFREDTNLFQTTRHKKKNGEQIFVETRNSIITMKGKDVLLTLAIDITERIRYVTALEKQNEKLKEIAWIQSHLFRAPLARMLALIDIFKDEEISEGEKKAICSNIAAAARELDDLIQGIVKKSESIELKG